VADDIIIAGFRQESTREGDPGHGQRTENGSEIEQHGLVGEHADQGFAGDAVEEKHEQARAFL
jgi:hypothetical protein